ncbi:hypothetical protein LCGC14_1892900 [marine sediment metagenome]|uniref:Uncharacterized protein n=1 Tax=marine sediment metagenome TaxID=412755 RepID=A0A0F9ICR7_9ZZZZ
MKVILFGRKDPDSNSGRATYSEMVNLLSTPPWYGQNGCPMIASDCLA